MALPDDPGTDLASGRGLLFSDAAAVQEQMDADPRMFTKGLKNKAKLKMEAGFNYARRSAEEVLRDPGLLYRPMKDVLLGTKEFIKDLASGPVEGKAAYMKAARDFSGTPKVLEPVTFVKFRTDWWGQPRGRPPPPAKTKKSLTSSV